MSRRQHPARGGAGYRFLGVALGLVLALPLVLTVLYRDASAQVPIVERQPYATVLQGSRSVQWVVGVTPTAAGAIQTFPSTWATDSGSTHTGGTKVTSIRHLGDTTAVLILQNVGTSLAAFMSIPTTRLAPLLPGESVSLSAQVTSVGYRLETGAGTLTESITGMTGGPLRIQGWK